MRLLALLTLLASAAVAAPPEPPFPPPHPFFPEEPVLSDLAEVSILTMLPGRQVHSLYGHTALRVRDPALGLDRTYNYGTFDFNQPFFVLRFLRGQLDYQLSAATFERTLAEYRFLRRPVLEQRLDLDPPAREAVFRYLETNLLPEHRVYRYDFLFDNCSTRPRDVLEFALGERLAFSDRIEQALTRQTFRQQLTPYQAADPGLDFAIGLGLGLPVDRRPTLREAMFLPNQLYLALAEATVDGRPLVAATDTLFWIEGTAPLGMPRPAFPWPLLLTVLLLGAAVVLPLRTAWERAARTLDVGVLALAGLVGTILALLWFATEHAVTRLNPDLLWAWPTHLAAAVLVARGVRAAWLRAYLGAAAVVALGAGGLGLMGLLPLHGAAALLALAVGVRCAALGLPRARRVSSPA